MSNVASGPLAGYNSLLDPHLSGFFTNSKMKKHLVKSGLVTKKGHIVSENTYRLNMARREHKKHVRDLLAQAIVHKTLDTERTRQVAIKQKLEEIAKIELVRRIRTERSRRRDDDLLPYLDPSGKKSGSRPQSGASSRSRPKSAPAKSRRRRTRSEDRDSFTLDDDGMPQSRPRSGHSDDSERPRSRKSRSRAQSAKERIDDKHLYSLNQQALQEYTMGQYHQDAYRGSSPYTVPQYSGDMVPNPPPSGTPRSARQRPRTATRQGSPDNTNRGSLMLHRPEPALKHQERVQTLCDVTMHYFGKTLRLDYERFDPRDEVTVEQQHCGGNTLNVFREHILPGTDFTFTSRRHRGYPFSMTFYVNGIQYCRLSTCCEYKHPAGARLGGERGYFSVISIEGAAPCYKCQVKNDKSDKKKKKKKSEKKKEDEDKDKDEDDREDEDDDVQGSGDETDRHVNRDPGVEVVVEEGEDDDDQDYKDDFDSKSATSTRSSRSSRSSSPASSRSYSDDNDHQTTPRKDERKAGDGEWKIRVHSSDVDLAGTDANVFLEVFGRKDGATVTSGRVTLDNKGNNFERGAWDEFDVTLADVGEPFKVVVGQDGTGACPGWHLDTLELVQQSSGRRYSCQCQRWLSADEDDGATVRELAMSGDGATAPSTVTYTLQVYTGDKWGAGTDSTVHVNLRGDQSDTGNRTLAKAANHNNKFERGQMDEFTLEAVGLGALTSVVVGHNGDNPGAGWYLDKVVVTATNGQAPLTFNCDRWLDVDQDDKKIEIELRPSEVPQKASGMRVIIDKADGSSADSSSQAAGGVESGSEESRAASNQKRQHRTKKRTKKLSSSSSSSSGSSSSSSSGGRSKNKKIDRGNKQNQASTVSLLAVPPRRPPVTREPDSGPVTSVETHAGSIRPLISDGHDIEIEGVKLSNDQVSELCAVLAERPGLEALTLRDTALTPGALERVAGALCAPGAARALTMLNLNCNPLSPAAAHHLLAITRAHPGLELLLLHDCGLGDVGVHTLVRGLLREPAPTAEDDLRAAARHLVSGVLAQAVRDADPEHSGNDDVAAAPGTAGKDPALALEHLDLGDCDLSDRGVDDLAALLAANTHLDTLCLTGNRRITPRGWGVLGRALAPNTTLTTLMLDYTTLGDEGVTALADGLRGNSALRSLDLEGNKITDVGCAAMVRLVQGSPGLVDVTLTPGNHISQHLLAEITATLEERA